MRDEEPQGEIPEGWSVDTFRFSGNFQLIAEFTHEQTGAEVRVNPYKTYSDQPGFCDAHRVILIHPEDGVREVAKGMEVEYVEEAEQAAVDAMQEF